ncbi:MAG: class I SAM-dependent methyltransferase, partial [Elusimicrobia bacterium]|nr:class I SAM-dependent methyltransferase [Elusimicrobiota bacterium]
MTKILRRMARQLIKADEEGRRTHLAIMRLLTKVRDASNLLDVGCYQGLKTAAYAEFLRIPLDAVVGIEPQECYAIESRKKFKVYGVDIEKDFFPVPDESFDLVICNQVLEHLKNIFQPLGELDRVVKTGGYLLLGIPNLSGFYNRLLLLVGKQPLAIAINGPHIRGFAHSAFLEFLRLNPNFKMIGVDSANLYPLPYPLIEWLGGKFAGLSTFTFYLLKKQNHNTDSCAWKKIEAKDTCF